MQRYLEHPQDVLGQWLDWQAHGTVALVAITKTEGGAVREAGALMAVNAAGDAAGYISGGCLDADIILQAQQTLEAGKPRHLRYGAGSPFIDLPLPCGGAIEIAIVPEPDAGAIRTCQERLTARQPASLELTNAGFTARYTPKLRLRIAGRGADPLALARLARASGIDHILQLRDGEDVTAAREDDFEAVTPLELPADLPPLHDDPWTAFILMFHDNDWEGPLLKQALDGKAFYVGAVGSRKTHARRCASLREQGVPEADIARIRGPVGLVPSMRDASMLANSVLAEIIAAFHDPARRALTHSAMILLAAGASSRFEEGDKLLASFQGKRVIDHAASVLAREPVAARFAVIPPDSTARQEALEVANWLVVENPDPDTGQASSLQCGLESALAEPGVDSVLVLLADMPAVPDEHLRALAREIRSGHAAAMSESGGVLLPPAIFRRDTFNALMALSGDKGAKAVFKDLDNTVTVELDPAFAFDIDTSSDLVTAEEASHA